MAKKHKKYDNEDISLDIDIFNDPEKLEKALLHYVSPSDRKRTKKKEKKAKKIASSFMDNIEENLLRQVSLDEAEAEEAEPQIEDNDFSNEIECCTWTTDESNTFCYSTDCGHNRNTVNWRDMREPDILKNENGEEICPYCGKIIEWNDIDYDALREEEENDYEIESESTELPEEYKNKFPELVYGDEEESEPIVADRQILSSWFEYKKSRIWINDEYVGSKTFEIVSDSPMVDGYYDDDTTVDLLFILFKIWIINSRPDYIDSLGNIKEILAHVDGCDFNKIDLYVINLFNNENDLTYVYIESDDKLKNFMSAFDTVFEDYNNNEIVDLIVRIASYINKHTFFDILTEEERKKFENQNINKNDFIEKLNALPKVENDDNVKISYIKNRSIFLEHLYELTGYEDDSREDEGVEHDREPFPVEEDDNSSIGEPEVDSTDFESEPDDSSELSGDDSGTDGKSGDDDTRKEDEEIEEKEEVKEESDDESDSELEKELEEGFDEIEV